MIIGIDIDGTINNLGETVLKIYNRDSGDNLQMKDIKKLIRDHSSDENGTSLLITDIYKVTASSDSLPVEYSLGASNDKENTENAIREEGFECISFSQYKDLLEAQGKKEVLQELTPLNDDEVILMKYQLE